MDARRNEILATCYQRVLEDSTVKEKIRVNFTQNQLAIIRSVKDGDVNEGMMNTYQNALETVFANREVGLDLQEVLHVLYEEVKKICDPICSGHGGQTAFRMYCSLVNTLLVKEGDTALEKLERVLRKMLWGVRYSHPWADAYFEIWQSVVSHCSGTKIVEDFMNELNIFEHLPRERAPLETASKFLELWEAIVTNTPLPGPCRRAFTGDTQAILTGTYAVLGTRALEMLMRMFTISQDMAVDPPTTDEWEANVMNLLEASPLLMESARNFRDNL